MKFTLRQARRLKDYTIPFMAKEIGVSEYVYRRYEKNPERVSIDTAVKICRILNMSMEQIFFDSNSNLIR